MFFSDAPLSQDRHAYVYAAVVLLEQGRRQLPVKRLIMLAKNNAELTFEPQFPPSEVHIMGYIWGLPY